MRITVLGLGSWGTALAKVLNENGHDVIAWARETELVEEINEQKTNVTYLPEVRLPDNFTATTSFEEAVQDAEMIVIVVPSKAIREVSQRLQAALTSQTARPIIVHAAKGLESQSGMRVSEVIEEVISPTVYQALVVLSGPSHAEEVARCDLTTITAASHSLSAAKCVQDAFMNLYFRVYTNPDMIGVELGGALKNIIAVCSGMLIGLGYGDNAKAALITRGLAEITRLGVQMGANPLTFSGLSGVGDLIVTCTSVHSRNWQAGNLLAKGLTMAEVEQEVNMVIEGFNTCRVAQGIAKEYEVEMPITEALYQLLYAEEPISVEEGIRQLMGRSGKNEVTMNMSNKGVSKW